MAVREDRTFEKIIGAAAGLVIVLLAVGWATRDDPAEKPFLGIVGGGFVYNYREAIVYTGLLPTCSNRCPSGHG
ncbi:hypothetical protein WNZ14_02305 [Hoeflea sp. AS60]|uniref:hypothetical protein n=1 Tax=Hoeflea sp. AS60 TaxID=3135780 RepID=UPI00317F91E7